MITSWKAFTIQMESGIRRGYIQAQGDGREGDIADGAVQHREEQTAECGDYGIINLGTVKTVPIKIACHFRCSLPHMILFDIHLEIPYIKSPAAVGHHSDRPAVQILHLDR